MARPNRCRSHRSAAARSWAKPGTPPTRAWASASAGPSRGSTPGSSRSATIPFPPGPTTCSCPTARSARSSWPGPVVTREYFNRPEATSLAKIADPARQTFYHRMGDVGYRDDQGRLWFCGRKSHRVILADETLFTIPCESIFNTHPEVARSALVGVKPAGPGRAGDLRRAAPAADADRNRTASAENCSSAARRSLIPGGSRRFLFHPSFPVDIRHNAKIFREKLAVWASRRLS